MPAASIHDDTAVDFVAAVTSDPWVLSTLRGGLVPQFHSSPPPYREPLNQSAMSRLPFVRAEVAKLLAAGKISQVSSQPRCCNPLSVAVRASNGDLRLVIDLSRHVNLYVTPRAVRMETLTFVSPWISPSSSFMAFDFKGMYHQLRVHPDFCTFFGFAIPNEEGGESYYVYNVLPFGFNDAVNIMYRLCAPVKNFVRSLSLKLGLYIDDGLFIHDCAVHIYDVFLYVVHLFRLAGWQFNWEKTSTVPLTSIRFLGLMLNAPSMTVSVPSDKLLLISSLLTNLFVQPSVPVKEFASVMGKISALRPALGLIVCYLTRICHHELGLVVVKEGWSARIFISSQIVRELSLLLKFVPRANGQPIIVHDSPFQLASLLPPFPNMDPCFVSDSSTHFSYVYDYYNDNVAFMFEFSPATRAGSSGLRELEAVTQGLRHLDLSLFAGRTVSWVTDSLCVYHWLRKGSRIVSVQTALLDIKTLEFEFNFNLCCSWSSRSHPAIQFADAGSRLGRSTDEWSIDVKSRLFICRLFGLSPTLDCFASYLNAVCTQFYSCMPMQGSLGVDFFVQNPPPGAILWCCPPPSLAAKCFLRLLFLRNSAVLVVPVWHSANFWPLIVHGNYFHPRVHFCHLFYPQFSAVTDCVFSRPHSFGMLAVKVLPSERFSPIKVPFCLM